MSKTKSWLTNCVVVVLVVEVDVRVFLVPGVAGAVDDALLLVPHCILVCLKMKVARVL